MKNKTAEHVANIDKRLGEAGQQTIKSLIQGLPEDTVSMAWRSALNEKLAVEAASRRKRRQFALYLRPMLGLGLATALGAIVLIQAPRLKSVSIGTSSSVSSQGLEAALVSTHRQVSYAMDVAGVGLNPTETPGDGAPASNASPSNAAPSGWSEDDLEAL